MLLRRSIYSFQTLSTDSNAMTMILRCSARLRRVCLGASCGEPVFNVFQLSGTFKSSTLLEPATCVGAAGHALVGDVLQL
jgi:hypothetical protein